MYWLVGLMSLAIIGLIVSGILLEFRPGYAPRISNLNHSLLHTPGRRTSTCSGSARRRTG